MNGRNRLVCQSCPKPLHKPCSHFTFLAKAFIGFVHNRPEVRQMLKECKDHGYFRAEFCPVCGDEGRFLMNDEELDRMSRTMAGVLRHFPERFDLRVDRHGFVDLKAFVNALQRK